MPTEQRVECGKIMRFRYNLRQDDWKSLEFMTTPAMSAYELNFDSSGRKVSVRDSGFLHDFLLVQLIDLVLILKISVYFPCLFYPDHQERRRDLVMVRGPFHTH
jgi:hypothetical protein